MTELNQIYRCKVCGNIVSVLYAGQGQLVCCGKPMNLLNENTTDAAEEKHIPVIETSKNKIIVKIGSELHPMIPEHYIEFIELISGKKSYLSFLKPGQEPKAEFCILENSGDIIARAYCNLHGLWKSN